MSEGRGCKRVPARRPWAAWRSLAWRGSRRGLLAARGCSVPEGVAGPRAGGAGTGDVEKGLACRTKESERYSTSNGKLGKAFKEGAIELGLTF